jgi:hypothetical protein
VKSDKVTPFSILSGADSFPISIKQAPSISLAIADAKRVFEEDLFKTVLGPDPLIDISKSSLISPSTS